MSESIPSPVAVITNPIAAPTAPSSGLAEQLRRIPPSFFSISMGIFGLAGVWRLCSAFFAVPVIFADALAIFGGAVYVLLLAAAGLKLLASPRAVIAELAHPILGPFYALLPVSGMLLCLQLKSHAPAVAGDLGMLFVASTVLLGGWLTGQWIADGIDMDKMHPGYFLPTVAGGLIAADAAGQFGYPTAAWMCFGIGMICWLVLGSIILTRLLFRPRLPAPLIPTLAIEVAPPAVAGSAYFTLSGGHIDALAYVLGGYCVLMVLVQLRLIGPYRRVPFAASFWAFTFSYEAVAADGLRWMYFAGVGSAKPIGLTLVSAVTLFVGWIAVRSVFAMGQGTFLPAPPAAVPAAA